MEVSITRTGGFFASPPKETRLSAEDLDAAERGKLDRLVELSGGSAAGSPAPDAYRYTVTTLGAEESTAVVNEATAPPELRELLHWATSRGVQKPP